MSIRKSAPADQREKILDLIRETEKSSETNVPMGAVVKKRSGSFFKKLGIIIIIILVVFVIVYGVSKYTKLNFLKLGGSADKEWQSVFLSNGQVYFGHVVKKWKEEIVLKDIYYLQVNNQIQPQENNASQQPAQQPELSLVKLGSELHGPEDEMIINRAHVLFIENLKNDSRVVSAIKNYTKK